MSLLDDVSIVVTPNGYKAGELYAVIPVTTEGAEEVTNGDFATDSDWTKVNSTISSGKATVTVVGGANSYITQTLSYTSGQKYKLTATINGTSGKEIKFQDRGNNSGGLTTTNGTVTLDGSDQNIEIYWIANSNSDGIVIARSTTSGDYIFTIDNVSVKEYTSADMDVTRATAATRVDENGLVNYAEIIGSEEVTNGDFATTIPLGNTGSGWGSIVGDVVYYDGGVKLTRVSSTNRLRARTITGSDNILTQGKQYLLNYSVLENNNCTSFKAYHGGSSTTLNNTVGNHTIYFTQDSSDQVFQFTNNTNNSNITIDNVSVKEVTRDNVPRIDYTGGGCPHILSEPQRTNLVTYSNTTNQWTDVGITYSVDSTISPDGTLNGSKAIIDDTITSSNTRPMTSVSITSGLDYVFSVFGKADEFDIINLDFSNSAFGTTSVTYNLTDGTVTSFAGSPVSQGVEDYGNGWYRCYVVATAIATGTSALIIRLDANPTGDGTSGLYLWGADFQQGSYPTSYIPTSGSTVTRNQDIFTRDGIGSLINDSEGVLFVEMAALADDLTFRSISLNDGTNTNSVGIRYRTTSNRINAIIKDGNGVTFQMNFDVSDITEFNKIALKYKSGDNSLYINGTEVLTNSSTFSFTSALNDASFNRGDGNDDFFGKVKQLQVYNTALTDEQLLQLTGESGTDFYESYAEMATALTYTIQ